MENYEESNKDSNEVSKEKSNCLTFKIKNILSNLMQCIFKIKLFDKLFHFQGVDYLLSYKLNYKINDPRDLSINEIYEYVETFYRSGLINKANLRYDLVIFKSYKDELEVDLRMSEFFVTCLNGVITAFAIIASLLFPDRLNEISSDEKIFGLIVIASLYIFVINYAVWIYPNSKPHRIKALADNINYLNSMKEEIYNLDKRPTISKENSKRMKELEKFETSKKKE